MIKQMIEQKFTLNCKWNDGNKEISNTMEFNAINLEDISERLTDFLRGCGFYLERLEVILEDEYENKV